MNYLRRFRVLHFLEVAGQLLWRGIERGMWDNSWTIVKIAWKLTAKYDKELEDAVKKLSDKGG